MAHAPTSDTPNTGTGRSRSSRRISITVNHATYKALEDKSAQEGRSISNLASHLLERSFAKENSEQST